jgi:hypothetical protein
MVNIKKYVENNPCDMYTKGALQNYNSGIGQGRIDLDYFIYTLCEAACDCVPQVNADPITPTLSTGRGNCQAHVWYDVCKLYPNIDVIKKDGNPWPSGWPKVCPLLQNWIRTSDGKNFLNVPITTVDPAVDTFLRQLSDANELLSKEVYSECLLLEEAMGRITIASGPTPVFAPTRVPTPRPTPVPTPVSAPSSKPFVTSFYLINAQTNSVIKKLNNNDVLYTGSLGTTILSVRADTTPESVGSVVFALNGNSNFLKESTAPYALMGDSNGKYVPWSYKSGQLNVLKATPFTSVGGAGDAGVPLELRFTIIDGPAPQASPKEPPTPAPTPLLTLTPKAVLTPAPTLKPTLTPVHPITPAPTPTASITPPPTPKPILAPPQGIAVTAFTLINTSTNGVIRKMNNGDVLYADSLGSPISIRAETAGIVGSVIFALNGNNRFQMESTAPFALKGDVDGSYKSWSYVLGAYTLKATPFTSPTGSGSSGASLEIKFTIEGSSRLRKRMHKRRMMNKQRNRQKQTIEGGERLRASRAEGRKP